MPLIKCQIVFERTSGLPEDRVVNDLYFHMEDAADESDTIDSIDAALVDFWQQPLTTAATLSTYLATDVSRAADSAKRIYYRKDEDEGPFGSPSRTVTWQPASAASATGLPDEVALCLSFHGPLTDIPEEAGLTRPASRRRGRIFLGPLVGGVMSTGAGLATRPAQVLVDDMLLAATQLHAASEAAADWYWAVVHAAGTAGWSDVSVMGGWVDNAWDTQRRRGISATSRDTFPV